MFALGDKEWPGVSKLIEECGELVQVLGKLIQSRGEREHWSGDLVLMAEDEIGDVLAAIRFVIKHSCLRDKETADRSSSKMLKFEEWHKNDNVPRKNGQDHAQRTQVDLRRSQRHA